MPYITSVERALRKAGLAPHSSGQLNDTISKRLLAYLGDSPNDSSFNETIGVLECVKQELYRRMIVPYENKKVVENEDIFP